MFSSSNEKVFMNKIDDFCRVKEHLKDQIRFLINSCDYFDRGYICEGKRIALHLYMVFVSADNKQSLIRKAFGSKCEEIKIKSYYLSEDEKILLRNKTIEELSKIRGIKKISPFRGYIRDSQPNFWLDETGKLVMSPFFVTEVIISDWLNQDILTVEDRAQKVNRKILLERIRHDDGGAHVNFNLLNEVESYSKNKDPLNKTYRDKWIYRLFTRAKKLFSDGDYEFKIADQHLKLLRQFAHEALMSSDLLKNFEKEGIIIENLHIYHEKFKSVSIELHNCDNVN
jgi:hypothetical protein